VARRPAQVHPQEHLRPVGRLGSAGTRADRDHRPVAVVFAAEQQQRALAFEVLRERRDIPLEVGLELRIGGLGQELGQLLDGSGPSLEAAPRLDLISEALRFLQDGLGGSLIVPETGDPGLGVQLGEAPLGGLEVKDAPTSTGSARRDP
jgi:hypothetical protein